jgi:hypothetical protein
VRCEICHAAVLTIDEERNPIEVTEGVNGSVRTYTVRCCAGCREKLAEKGAKERNPKGGAV